jgi:hypothetical protein
MDGMDDMMAELDLELCYGEKREMERRCGAPRLFIGVADREMTKWRLCSQSALLMRLPGVRIHRMAQRHE